MCECDCENKTQIVLETGRLTGGKKRHCGCRKIRRTRDMINLPEEYYIKTKECVQCGNDKKYSEYYFQECFDKDDNITYIFHTICITCSKENAKNRILNNRESHLEALKKNNKRENIMLNKRAYSKKQKESGYYSDYINKPEVKARKYGARRRLKNHKVTPKEWISCKEYFKDDDGDYCCAYCGLKIQDHYRIYAGELQKIDLHKEHKNDNGSIFLDNCIPSCGSCNDKKWSFDFDDFYNETNPNYTKERYDKIIKWTTEDYKLYIISKHLKMLNEWLSNNNIKL